MKASFSKVFAEHVACASAVTVGVRHLFGRKNKKEEKKNEIENDVSPTDNNHGGKSMGVQEERNVVASREWTQKGRRLSWH